MTGPMRRGMGGCLEASEGGWNGAGGGPPRIVMKSAPAGVKIALMTCEKCKKKPATFHLTAIENGQKREAHLCEDCARETGVMNVKLNFSIP